jgi:hypothetical protein
LSKLQSPSCSGHGKVRSSGSNSHAQHPLRLDDWLLKSSTFSRHEWQGAGVVG